MKTLIIPVVHNLNKIICLILYLSVILGFNCLKAQSIPNASFTYTVGNGGTVHFTSTSTNTANLKFWWQFGDGTQLNDTIPAPILTYTNNGRYAVVLSLVTSSGILRDSITEAVTINNLTTDLKQLDSKKNLAVKIKVNKPLNYVELEIETFALNNSSLCLFDISGKKVLSQKITTANLCRINTSNFDPGIYTLIIESGDLVEMKKIVIGD